MKRFHTLLTGTALAALIAAPASALTIGADGNAGLSLDTTMSGSVLTQDERAGVQANAGAEQDSTLAMPDETAETAVTEPVINSNISNGSDRDSSMTQPEQDNVAITTPAMVDSEFEGDVVYSADAEVIGVVETVGDNGDGMQKLVVALDEGVEAGPVREISLTVDGQAESDGQIDLAWSKAELEAQLDELNAMSRDDKS